MPAVGVFRPDAGTIEKGRASDGHPSLFVFNFRSCGGSNGSSTRPNGGVPPHLLNRGCRIVRGSGVIRGSSVIRRSGVIRWSRVVRGGRVFGGGRARVGIARATDRADSKAQQHQKQCKVLHLTTFPHLREGHVDLAGNTPAIHQVDPDPCPFIPNILEFGENIPISGVFLRIRE